MSGTIVPTPDEPGDELERRQPFVPDRNRIVEPVDYRVSREAALDKFWAEIRIEVGGQLTKRLVQKGMELEDQLRAGVHDEAQYALLSAAISSYVGDAIAVRHRYMNPDEGGQR